MCNFIPYGEHHISYLFHDTLLLLVEVPSLSDVSLVKNETNLCYCLSEQRLECWSFWQEEQFAFVVLAERAKVPQFIMVGDPRHI